MNFTSLEQVGTLVAILTASYGAALSTVTFVRQLPAERVVVRVTTTLDVFDVESGLQFILRAKNHGKVPVHIQDVKARLPLEDLIPGIIDGIPGPGIMTLHLAPKTQPELPTSLVPGQSCAAYFQFEQLSEWWPTRVEDVEFKVQFVFVDQLGREFPSDHIVVLEGDLGSSSPHGERRLLIRKEDPNNFKQISE